MKVSPQPILLLSFFAYFVIFFPTEKVDVTLDIILKIPCNHAKKSKRFYQHDKMSHIIFLTFHFPCLRMLLFIVVCSMLFGLFTDQVINDISGKSVVGCCVPQSKGFFQMLEFHTQKNFFVEEILFIS